MHALAELIKTGVPVGAVFELSGQLLRAIDETVRGLVSAVGEVLLRDREQGWMPSAAELPEVARMVKAVKPLANTAATAALSLSLDRHMEDILGDYIGRLMPYLKPAMSDGALPVGSA